MEVLKVKLFKKKKDTYVEPIKPKSEILKVFQNYRLVKIFEPVTSVFQYYKEEKKRITGYESKLVLEEKLMNVMEEPFYKSIYHEDYYMQHTGEKQFNQIAWNNYKLMFKLLRELFINEN